MSVNIYGAGGAGLNVAARFINAQPESGMPEIRVVGLDASDSNVREQGKFKEDDLYLIPDTDGSGKHRKENYAVMSKHIPKVMMKIKPGEYNIVVYSDGGGSGSVFGPLMVKALTEAGVPVVSVVIGCGGNLAEAKNSFSTLQTLEGIADATESILALSYVAKASLARQDAAAQSAISCLLKLFSGKLDGTDSKDVINWIQHEIHTGLGSRVNTLHIAAQPEDLNDASDIISVASIYKDRSVDHMDIQTLYHSTGYGLEADNVDQLHYCLSEAEMDLLLKDREAEFKKYKEMSDSTVRNKPKVAADDAGFSF